jgi:hypothetical protein
MASAGPTVRALLAAARTRTSKATGVTRSGSKSGAFRAPPLCAARPWSAPQDRVRHSEGKMGSLAVTGHRQGRPARGAVHLSVHLTSSVLHRASARAPLPHWQQVTLRMPADFGQVRSNPTPTHAQRCTAQALCWPASGSWLLARPWQNPATHHNGNCARRALVAAAAGAGVGVALEGAASDVDLRGGCSVDEHSAGSAATRGRH